MALIGAVCDDFVGTASAGVRLARCGVRTDLCYDIGTVGKLSKDGSNRAVFVNTSSRHLPPERAAEEVRNAVRALKKLGADFYSKKIDSTLRGNIGSEIDAMLGELGDEAEAIVVTALPSSGRTCLKGNVYINGTPLTGTSAASDPIDPVVTDSVRRIIAAQSRKRTGLIDIDFVRNAGTHDGAVYALAGRIEEMSINDIDIIVIDAETDDDIGIIAEACAALRRPVLAVDPGAFTARLARARKLAGPEKEGYADQDSRGSGTAVYVIGSANPGTGEQLKELESSGMTVKRVSVSEQRLAESEKSAEAEIQRAAEQAESELMGSVVLADADTEADTPDDMYYGEGDFRWVTPDVLVIESGQHGNNIDPVKLDGEKGRERGTSAALICEGLGRIARKLLFGEAGRNISGFLFSGGDTAEAGVRALWAETIEIIDSIESQVDAAVMTYPDRNGSVRSLPIVLKGGFCGSAQALIKAAYHLRSEETARMCRDRDRQARGRNDSARSDGSIYGGVGSSRSDGGDKPGDMGLPIGSASDIMEFKKRQMESDPDGTGYEKSDFGVTGYGDGGFGSFGGDFGDSGFGSFGGGFDGTGGSFGADFGGAGGSFGSAFGGGDRGFGGGFGEGGFNFGESSFGGGDGGFNFGSEFERSGHKFDFDSHDYGDVNFATGTKYQRTGKPDDGPGFGDGGGMFGFGGMGEGSGFGGFGSLGEGPGFGGFGSIGDSFGSGSGSLGEGPGFGGFGSIGDSFGSDFGSMGEGPGSGGFGDGFGGFGDGFGSGFGSMDDGPDFGKLGESYGFGVWGRREEEPGTDDEEDGKR